MMKVMIVSRGFPSEENNYYGIFEYDQAKALAARGHQVIFLALDLRSIRHWRNWGGTSFVKDHVNIECLNVPCGKIPLKIFYFIGKIAFRYAFKKITKKFGKIDIINTHFIVNTIIATMALKSGNHVIVATEHSSEIFKNNIPQKRKKLIERAYKMTNQVVAVSQAFASLIQKVYGVEVQCIHNLVNTQQFYLKHEKKKDKFYFVTTANLIESKRILFLVQCFKEVYEVYNDMHLIVIGNGLEFEKIDRYIKCNNISSVTLLGRLTRKEIAEIYRMCNCFVLPSIIETFGVVYIEALAAGLPVIATKCGGPEDFINSENGILIDIDNKDELKSAMEYMYLHQCEFNHNKIRNYVEKNFSQDVIAQKIEKLFLLTLEADNGKKEENS